MACDYYIGEIIEINGEFWYYAKYLFKTDNHPSEYTDRVARTWRGSDECDFDEQHRGYWSDHNLIKDNGWEKITKDEFDILSKYLSVL